MADNNAPPVAPAKQGKLKLIIILVVALLLAIGLSVMGTLWFLGAGNDAPDSEETAEEAFVPSTYVKLDKAVVTTIQAEGRQRYAQAYLALEARDQEALTAAQLHLPLIRSQLVMVLGSSQYEQLQTPAGRSELADAMLATVNQVLEQEGEPVIERVLLQNFVVQ
ncbi:flagellar basal body-associated FliL family protein [Marinobacter salinisoli]|uniref:Flagellar protein FliL n=1 Tax=Marinobacter salinisoli TaxID=2769486 RepID=A0ABX7MQ10_9GAMM|nr:flagellar basal body-associated FliL family protein [Marinobacter salinisoli]QSP94401.1 flagellar basal body-associated FliL family protein [Marinobacter salinisoli]